MSKSSIKIKSNGIIGQVIKDGIDISSTVSAVDIKIRPSLPPEVTIEFISDDIEIELDEAVIKTK